MLRNAWQWAKTKAFQWACARECYRSWSRGHWELWHEKDGRRRWRRVSHCTREVGNPKVCRCEDYTTFESLL